MNDSLEKKKKKNKLFFKKKKKKTLRIFLRWTLMQYFLPIQKDIIRLNRFFLIKIIKFRFKT